jgi:hypothetical protein
MTDRRVAAHEHHVAGEGMLAVELATAILSED